MLLNWPAGHAPHCVPGAASPMHRMCVEVELPFVHTLDPDPAAPVAEAAQYDPDAHGVELQYITLEILAPPAPLTAFRACSSSIVGSLPPTSWHFVFEFVQDPLPAPGPYWHNSSLMLATHLKPH